MVYTVQAAFNEFFNEINLSGDHRTVANARRDHLIELLGNKFDVVESFSSGSIPKFTALHGHADLDIMLVLHFGKHISGKTPTQVLQSVRDALAYKTNVRKNGQAVTLHYNTWPSVDIVPVYYVHDDIGQLLHYRVPNTYTEDWIDSNPKNHAKAIQEKATECGEDFRKIIKIIKHWNKCHSNYLQNYHIEVLAQKVMAGTLGDITWHVHKFFEDSIPLLKSSLWDGLGYADAYLSYNDRQEVLKRFEAACSLSQAAWYHTYGTNNDHSSAIATWQRIFGDKFPSYG